MNPTVRAIIIIGALALFSGTGVASAHHSYAMFDAKKEVTVEGTVKDEPRAPGGVELHDGTLLRGATLDALVGAHPGGFALPSRTFRTVAIALARHGAAWTPERDDNACVTLVPCARVARA